MRTRGPYGLASLAIAAGWRRRSPSRCSCPRPPRPRRRPRPRPPTPTPTAPPAAGALTSSAPDLPTAGAALTGRAFTVRVVLKPFVAGEKVTVRVYRGKRKIAVKALAPKPVAGNAAGVATLKVASGKPGKLRITASHRATPALATAVAKTLRVQRAQAVRVSRRARPAGAAAAGQARRAALRRLAQRRVRRRAPPTR